MTHVLAWLFGISFVIATAWVVYAFIQTQRQSNVIKQRLTKIKGK